MKEARGIYKFGVIALQCKRLALSTENNYSQHERSHSIFFSSMPCRTSLPSNAFAIRIITH